MAQIKIAINGFGRIGRIFFRQAFDSQKLEIAAINDIGSSDNLAYLLKYDSVYGPYEKEVSVSGDVLTIGGKKVQVLHEKEPSKLPWKDLGIDIVVESTGVFESRDTSESHLSAGAKRVVITAPAKDDITPTATPNVGEEFLQSDKITSNASCTTNAVTPVMAVMMAEPGIKKAILNTVHGYTASQGLVDGPDKKGDFRRARAAGINIVPSTTGAALAATKAIPALADKFDGISLRVPVISGSIADFTFISARPTSVEEVNDIFKKAAQRESWKGILAVTEEPLVSTDILRNPHGSIVDLTMTKVVDGDLVKVLAWYDNEWGYGAMLLKHILAVAELL
ncbi:MAG: type I glyceraldehyde-3-phosphate dehydrogenase [Candidatus Yanofskybacteria bacterium RIFCSPHIGHO2_01_FULL_41_27]|uniref:Type I glyceraldehyde-3-phosphate dehydrogenase n=2 Tax=Candidatus Yanofskyibacteriota TaxID=1752733 RepID=A0A1F8HQH6_9BACT|nr:MAG: type I glyceraldehyde-3-phosphate dehydrogenase [Candidatus Yanofskybacteria bacterium RIFCSPHIGHO2_01_FULL_41_27]OGN19912.1 MAG: type I glyceraldehyde-3-phosphate dehydrogenase [Candidatus Yanofskybacteria bacterium RIFCSPLOWO2_01_FULL_41_33]OGN39389.1 MAG: type I glyceraldehyde-3-phosphate dehydrogenase [Candidatus Yanofskybacteria bacterium RIFOXYD1_FULL_42_10]